MYKHFSLILFALMVISGMGLESAHAFGIPDIPRKKDKKKSRRKKKAKKQDEQKAATPKSDETKTEESKTEEAKKEDTAAAKGNEETQKADKETSKKEVAKAKEPEIQTSEIPLQKESWAHYKDLTVGDFTLYEYEGQNMTTRNEVIAKDEKSITVLTTNDVGGKLSKSKVRYVHNTEIKTTEKTISVGDKQVKAKVRETYVNGKLLHRIVSSADVPLSGMLWNEDKNGKVYMKLKDFRKQ